MRVILANRFFQPDHSATSQHFTDLAEHLAACGATVLAIASRQRIDDPGARLASTGEHRGVTIHRLDAMASGRRSAPARLLDYAGFALAARRALRGQCRSGDAVIAGTDPPLLGAALLAVVRARGARLYDWLHDLFPEVAQAVHLPGASGPIGRWLLAARDRALTGA